MAYPPQELTCPDPAGCPVLPAAADLLAAAPVTVLPATTRWYRVYDGTWGYDEPNPGYGDTRFAPFDAPATGARVPTLYLAGTITAALLETVFHDADHTGGTVVAEENLRASLLAHVQPPRELTVVDLRDPALHALGVARSAVSASNQEHYPCTRRIAQAAHTRGVQGIIWHSRQAELHQPAGQEVDPSEVVVVFCDQLGVPRGGWRRIGPGSQSLVVDSGRALVDHLADQLGVTILTA